MAVNFIRRVESQNLGNNCKQRAPTTSYIKLEASSKSSNPVIQVKGEQTCREGPGKLALSSYDGVLIVEV